MKSFAIEKRGFTGGLIVVAVLSMVLVAGVATLHQRNNVNAEPIPESCFVFNAGTQAITDYNPTNDPACDTNVDIPSTIGGITVSTIGENAMRGKGLIKVLLPNTVTTIENNAFRENDIAYMDFPDSVTSIGSAAFYDNDLASLTLPPNLSVISDSAFERNDLTSLTIPEGVTTILWNAFGGNQLTSIDFPDTLLSISAGSFANNQLESIDLPENLQSMTGGSFYNNKLTSVTLPASLTQLWDPATPWFGPDVFANNFITTVYVEGDVPIPSDTFLNNVANTGQYIQLYTVDETNPHGYADLAGTYVVNPAQLHVNYVDNSGTPLAAHDVKVGDNLSDYTVAANPAAYFSLYWRALETVTSQPIEIDGYMTPPLQSGVVHAGVNSRTFVYAQNGEVTPVNPIVPGVPNTGLR